MQRQNRIATLRGQPFVSLVKVRQRTLFRLLGLDSLPRPAKEGKYLPSVKTFSLFCRI